MLILRNHNIRLIDFSAIFKKNIEADLLNDLYSFNLLKDDSLNLRSPAVKRLMHHHIIYGLCEHVLAVKGKEKIVIIHCQSTSPTRQLHMFTDHKEVQTFFNKFIDRIIKMFPVKFLITDLSFNTIRKDIKSNNGDSVEIINEAKYIIDNFDISKYTFSKARYFAKKYGLEFLSNNYFQQILKKQLILS
jgi:hypothetical protein